MSHNATPEETMGRLHAIVADTLIKQLDGTPILGEDGEEIGYSIDPRIISAAITFLNNNKVTMNPFLTEALSEIESKLSNKTQRFKLIKEEAVEAARKAAANG